MPSVSRRENCWDNAVAESFLSNLKKARVKRRIYASRQDAKSDVFDCIEDLLQSSPQAQSRRPTEPAGIRAASNQKLIFVYKIGGSPAFLSAFNGVRFPRGRFSSPVNGPCLIGVVRTCNYSVSRNISGLLILNRNMPASVVFIVTNFAVGAMTGTR